MRKLILKMSMSLDGFVAGPNGEIDWIFKTTDDAATDWIVKTISNAGLHLMGSKTFHDMAAWWPTSTEPFAAPMNNIPKAVFTKKGFTGADPAKVTPAVRDAQKAREQKGETIPATRAGGDSWAHPRVFDGDLATAIRQLKEETSDDLRQETSDDLRQEPGDNLLAHGGGGFAQSLVATGLIDEYQLLVHPVVLGAGLPLFSSLRKPVDLQLVEIIAFPGGAAAHVYRPG
jgi:dihydrofolate reductase